jgi:hypothetical protein
MQLPNQPVRVDAIDFKDTTVAGSVVRRAFVDRDIIIQVLKGDTPLPSATPQRVAKALVDTVGELAMENVLIEDIQDDLIDGGSSVFIRCSGMNTDVIKSVMFPRFYHALGESMQEV